MQKKDCRHNIIIIPYQEPSHNTTKPDYAVEKADQAFFKTRVTFWDVITASWNKAKNRLTSKQRRWGEAFLALENPTSAAVARKLNISRTASSKMKLRLLKVLLPHYQSFLSEQEYDELFLTLALNKQEYILGNPEYLEKRRGQSHYMHWRAEKVWQERLGLFLATGRIGEQVKNTLELQKLKDLPIRHTSPHKASPLSLWWVARVEEEMSKKNTGYTVTYKKLYAFYWDKWPEKVRKEFDHLCRFCRCLLPLGEVVDGRKITKSRRYCSDSCKTYFKRHHLIFFKKY